MLLKPPSVYVKDTGTAKGRGAFALRDFTAGEVIEVCPVVIYQVTSAPLPEELKKLVFDWGVLAGVPGTGALALGYGSMYNHDNPANMRYEADSANLALRFTAVRDIKVDEELTVNYNAIGGGAEWHNDNWFERMKVKTITG
jgi:SET domain-containing protein